MDFKTWNYYGLALVVKEYLMYDVRWVDKKSSDVPDILDVALQTYPFAVHIYVREHVGHVLATTVG